MPLRSHRSSTVSVGHFVRSLCPADVRMTSMHEDVQDYYGQQIAAIDSSEHVRSMQLHGQRQYLDAERTRILRNSRCAGHFQFDAATNEAEGQTSRSGCCRPGTCRRNANVRNRNTFLFNINKSSPSQFASNVVSRQWNSLVNRFICVVCLAPYISSSIRASSKRLCDERICPGSRPERRSSNHSSLFAHKESSLYLSIHAIPHHHRDQQ